MADIGAGRINTIDPLGGPKVWQREGRDVRDDTLKSARDIGTVRLEHSRLNAFSALSKGEVEDNFKFKVASKGDLRLGKNIDDGTRIQIFNGAGRVIADSKSDTGRHFDKYERMISDKGESFDKGNYVIKISRLNPSDKDVERPYTLQLKMGTEVKHDYETIEYKAKELKPGEVAPAYDPLAGVVAKGSVMQAQGLAAMFDSAAANLSRILSGAANILFGSSSR